MTRSFAARIFFLSTAMSAALAASACQTARLEDLAPLPGVRNTGTTPNLNVAPKAETTQFSETDKNAKTAELKAALTSQGVKGQSAVVNSSAVQIRKAAQTQTQTLKEIEGE